MCPILLWPCHSAERAWDLTDVTERHFVVVVASLWQLCAFVHVVIPTFFILKNSFWFSRNLLNPSELLMKHHNHLLSWYKAIKPWMCASKGQNAVLCGCLLCGSVCLLGYICLCFCDCCLSVLWKQTVGVCFWGHSGCPSLPLHNRIELSLSCISSSNAWHSAAYSRVWLES